MARSEIEVRNRFIAYEHLAKLAMPAEVPAPATGEKQES